MSSMHISAVRTAVSWSIRESAINKVGCHRHKHVHLVGDVLLTQVVRLHKERIEADLDTIPEEHHSQQ